jgi:AraC-like DNA-binding protein
MFRSNRLLVRLILSHLITGALLTGVLLLVVSGFVAGQITGQRYKSSQELLAQAYNTSYYALTDIYGDYYALWSKDPAIQAALSASSISDAQSRAVAKALDSVVFRDNLVHSVCLINEPANLVISNLAPPATLPAYFDSGAITLFHDFESQYQTAKNEVFFPRQATFTVSSQQESRNYISLVYATMNGSRLNSGLIVNIDQARLSALVNTSTANGQMMIVNRSGMVVSDLAGERFARGFAEPALYQEILADKASEGSRIGTYQGAQSYITFRKADTLGFVFLNLIPYGQLMAPVTQTTRMIILFFCCAILLSLLISLISTQRIYRPLNALIRYLQGNPAITADSGQGEYAYLDAAFGSLIAQNQQANLARLLQGHYNSRSLEILGFTRARFLAIAILPDLPASANRNSLDQLCQVIQKSIRLPAAVMPDNCIGLVINSDQFDETEMDWVTAQIGVLQSSAAEKTGSTVSIGIGSVAGEPAGIATSWRNALTAVQHAVSLGKGQIVPYSEIEIHRLNAGQNRAAVAAAIDSYIQENYARPGFTLEEIAEHVGLSVGYMRQIFKLERQVPVNDYIISFRIGKACDMLASTDMTAKDISESVGYLDSRYFYTLFKKKVGMTTDEYRRSTRREGSDEKV